MLFILREYIHLLFLFQCTARFICLFPFTHCNIRLSLQSRIYSIMVHNIKYYHKPTPTHPCIQFYTHIHTHTSEHIHVFIHVQRLGMFSWCLTNFRLLISFSMFWNLVHMCVCVCVRVCVHACTRVSVIYISTQNKIKYKYKLRIQFPFLTL